MVWITLTAAVGTGLVAGVFFAFSTFVMQGLALLPAPAAVAAMQAINQTAERPWLMSALFGTAAVCLYTGIQAIATWPEPGSGLSLAASALYWAGAVVTTAVCNVPRNNALAQVAADTDNLGASWSRYLVEWTMWNHVRTVSCLLASALFVLSLLGPRLPRLSVFTAALLMLTGCQIDRPYPLAPPGGHIAVERLSQLEIFEGDVAKQRPKAAFVAFEVNVPLFSDDAAKHRWVFVPPGARVQVTDGYWQFPEGSYLVKTFSFPRDLRHPELGERWIETRLLVKTARGFTASTYLWNDAQTDAYASAGNIDVPVSWVDERGARQDRLVHVPGTSQCASCHQGRALGWRAAQLDRLGPEVRGGREERQNQIARLFERGMLDRLPAAHATFVNHDGGAPLEVRARSYLDANCGFCHGSQGSAERTGLFWDWAHTDAAHLPFCRSTASVDGNDLVLVSGHPERSEFLSRMLTERSKVRMPRGPNRIADRAGVSLLWQWVASMQKSDCLE